MDTYSIVLQQWLSKKKSILIECMTDIKRLFIFFSIMVFAISCRTIQYIPIETNTNVRDSVITRIVDSTIYHHKTVNKDYSNLLDTLHIYGEHSSMTAYADTATFTIKGELEEDPYVEKIVYKTRTEYRDSLVYVDNPYPVEVEKPVRYVPLIYKILSIIGALALLSVIFYIFVKYLKI